MAPRPTEVRQRTMAEELAPHDAAEHETGASNGLGDADKPKLVGVNGKWYDVTNFLDKHPGGPVIEQFIGQDCTTVFKAYRHPDYVLKNRKPVGSYKLKDRHPADVEFDELLAKCEERGWFETDWSFYYKKSVFVACIYAAVWICVCCFESSYMHYLGGVCLAFLWQQSGFIMHEFMHGQVFRGTDRKNKPKSKAGEETVADKIGHGWCDRIGGLFFGTVLFGMSSHWWQDEHIVHHGMTNVVDVASRFVDPQMWESVWAQNILLFPLFKGWLQYLLVKVQHITFIPVVMFCGRAEIIIDSYRLERRWYEWIAIVLHWTWMIPLLSQLPTWREVFIFYAIAASVEGVFHFQLILSHYCRGFLTRDDFHINSWYEYQVLSNMNIDCPKWQDWYYGGLNYHIEHHLFPKMARKYLRRVGPEVEAICKKHNIDYDMRSFTDCLLVTLDHLKKTGQHYKLDPR